MNGRIESFIEAGWLARQEADDQEVVGLWKKAAKFLGDSRRSDYDDDIRLMRAYDAGRLAATALVRAHALRTRAQNHHEMVLRAAGYIGPEELMRLIEPFNRLRTLRSEIQYGWEEVDLGGQVAKAISMATDILALIAPELRKARPAIADQIDLDG